MTKLSLIAIAALFASVAAHAADPAPAPTAATPPKAIVSPAPQKAAPTPAPAAKPVAAISQQDKMRLCSKEATGKKGAERKTFMKTCLSKKA